MKRLLFVVLACAISSPSYALYISYMPVVDFSSFAASLSFADLQTSYAEYLATDVGSDVGNVEPLATTTTLAATVLPQTTTQDTSAAPLIPLYGNMFPDCNLMFCLNVNAFNVGGGDTGSGTTIPSETDLSKTQTPSLTGSTTTTPIPTTSVPEPGTIGMMLMGGLVILLSRRRLWAQTQTS